MAEAVGEKTVTFASNESISNEATSSEAVPLQTAPVQAAPVQTPTEGAIQALTSMVTTALGGTAATAPPPKKTKSKAPAAQAAAAAPASRRTRLIPIPKDSASFFNARAKDVKAFTFTKDGNLSVPEMRGEPAKIIELPFYRAANIDEIREKEESIKDALSSVEQEFDETAKLLRESIAEWRSTGAASDVIQHQRTLARLDAQRTMIRSPLRWIQTFKNPDIREIILDNKYEERKLGYPVSALILRNMTFEEMVRVGQEPVKQIDLEKVGEDEETEAFIFFFDPADTDYGILSPETMVDFIFNSTKYTSILQAYEVERVTMVGRKDIRPLLLRQRNPKQIRKLSAGIVGKLENPLELWILILKAVAAQDTRYRNLLQETGTDNLVYADPRDEVLGIGLPAEDPASMNRKEWKGQNMLGQAWQAVRTSLETAEEGASAAGAAGAAGSNEVGSDEVGTNQVGSGSGAAGSGAAGSGAAGSGAAGSYTEHGRTEEEVKADRAKVFRGGYYRRH